MDAAAALLNDVAKSTYSYTVQIPYLNMALRELQELFELNEVPVTDETSSTLTVPASTSEITFTSTPALPSDLIEPKLLWESSASVGPYVPMTRVNFLPLSELGVEISQFIEYVWAGQKIKVLPANATIYLKIDYVRNLFATVTTSTDSIGIINAISFLQYRTAGLVAEHVEENKPRADQLNADASLSLDRVIGIGSKGRQAIFIRHRPFRARFKQRSN